VCCEATGGLKNWSSLSLHQSVHREYEYLDATEEIFAYSTKIPSSHVMISEINGDTTIRPK